MVSSFRRQNTSGFVTVSSRFRRGFVMVSSWASWKCCGLDGLKHSYIAASIQRALVMTKTADARQPKP